MANIFGPVPSRRLGLSLGIDLVPLKICSLNCLYCECGKTKPEQLTSERKPYIPADEIIDEFNRVMSLKPVLDFITLTGSGEPTLNTEIGRVIKYIKDRYPQYKIALLTNSTMFHIEEVRKSVADIDVILPSLDAASEEMFKKINQPDNRLNAAQLIEGLVKLKQEFKGLMWLEYFIVPGINDTSDEVKLMKEVLLKINPDKVQINSLDRPSAYTVKKAALESLFYIKDYLHPLECELIAKFNSNEKIFAQSEELLKERIKEVIKRRPLTIEDIISVIHKNQNIIKPVLTDMLKSGELITESHERGMFYKFHIK